MKQPERQPTYQSLPFQEEKQCWKDGRLFQLVWFYCRIFIANSEQSDHICQHFSQLFKPAGKHISFYSFVVSAKAPWISQLGRLQLKPFLPNGYSFHPYQKLDLNQFCGISACTLSHYISLSHLIVSIWKIRTLFFIFYEKNFQSQKD